MVTILPSACRRRTRPSATSNSPVGAMAQSAISNFSSAATAGPSSPIISGDNPAMAGTLPRLKLGKLALEPLLESDVRADLEEEDAKNPPTAGRSTFVQHLEQMIKKEEDEEGPTRGEIPYPPSTARDVAMEVQKVKENRDRFKIEGRTGGVGPAISVCMFTFHNTHDAYARFMLLKQNWVCTDCILESIA